MLETVSTHYLYNICFFSLQYVNRTKLSNYMQNRHNRTAAAMLTLLSSYNMNISLFDS